VIVKYLTSEQHYAIAEKLLADLRHLDKIGLHASTGRLQGIAQIHATLACAGITEFDVERFEARDKADREVMRHGS
jgi:hypothetical protein